MASESAPFVRMAFEIEAATSPMLLVIIGRVKHREFHIFGARRCPPDDRRCRESSLHVRERLRTCAPWKYAQ